MHTLVRGIHLELLLVGVLVGLLLAGLIVSPLGRVSGGHLNPAISLAMWRYGVFPGWGVLPYVAAQLAGSLLGVLLARAAWGPYSFPPTSLRRLSVRSWRRGCSVTSSTARY